jgi:hypothetical protein
MLWYGHKNKNILTRISRVKKLTNLKSLQRNWKVPLSNQLNKKTLYFHTPFTWDIVISENLETQSNSLFMYSATYYFALSIPAGFVEFRYDLNTRMVIIHSMYANNYYKIFWGKFRECINLFYSPQFLKLKFKGKGYYVYKNKRNTITPQFGYAHRLYLYSYFVSVKFLSKTSILLFGFLKSDLLKVGHGLKQMRPINIFTGRGVRFTKQVIYKKQGKVSSYR